MSADLAAELLLRFYREPSRYLGDTRRDDAAPLDAEVILKIALGRAIEFTDPAFYEPKTAREVKEAASFYVRHVFFRHGATPYQVLGAARDASTEDIKENYRLLMQLVHPDRQGGGAIWSESSAARANDAYGILRDPESRAACDRDIGARAAGTAATTTFPIALRPTRGAVRDPPSQPLLPEWMTAGVGGFVREHPAVVAFSRMIVGSLLIIGVVAWDGRDSGLTRAARENRAPSPAVAVAAEAVARPTVSATAVDRATPASGSTERDSPVRALPSETTDAPVASTPESSAAPMSATAGQDVSAGGRSSSPEPGLTNMVAAPARRDADPPGAMASVAAPPAPHPAPTPRIAHAQRPPPAAPTPPTALAVTVVATAPVAPAAGSAAAPTTASTSFPATGGTMLRAAIENSARAIPSESARGDPAAAGTPALAPAAAVKSSAPVPRIESAALMPAPIPPTTAEIETLIDAFVSSYDAGRLDVFASLFDDDADTNLRRGRAAIRNEYDELFRLSNWRRMQLTVLSWRRSGDRAYAKGEIAVRIGWRDGREVEQRVAVEIDLVRRDGRALIARLSHQPQNP
jgi:ketosteroid isomerase-like protein